MRISVCLAAYNGEKYIQEQLDSILSEIGPDDEVIILDDCSKDNTLAILRSYTDGRVRVCENSINLGVNRTFGKLLGMASGDVVFLADQDDVWLPGRVNAMLASFTDGRIDLVSTNFELMDATGTAILDPSYVPLKQDDSRRHLSNIFGIFAAHRNYYGCAMAVRRQLLDIVLPIPSFVESHDLWVAMAANIVGANRHYEAASLRRRIHGFNVSVVKRPTYQKIRSRFIFLFSFFILACRALKREKFQSRR